MAQKKQYTADFKFKVVVESFQRDTTIEEVCRKFGLASSVIHRWRHDFQQHGPDIFADKRDPKTRSAAQGYAPGESPDDLKRLIGELAVQNELLKKSRGLLGN
ncbi:MAG: transposase [Chloroflexota bacterium]|nr:transposase [Chloroflexota bacterium]